MSIAQSFATGMLLGAAGCFAALTIGGTLAIYWPRIWSALRFTNKPQRNAPASGPARAHSLGVGPGKDI